MCISLSDFLICQLIELLVDFYLNLLMMTFNYLKRSASQTSGLFIYIFYFLS